LDKTNARWQYTENTGTKTTMTGRELTNPQITVASAQAGALYTTLTGARSAFNWQVAVRVDLENGVYNEMKQLAKDIPSAQFGSREHGIDYRLDHTTCVRLGGDLTLDNINTEVEALEGSSSKTSGLPPTILLTILTTSQLNQNCKDVLKT
jgi:hypothetical protein